MTNRLRTFGGILMIYLVSGVAFGDASASLAGRMYSNNLHSVEFLTESVGRVVEGRSEVEFSYEQDEYFLSFEGESLRPAFLRLWLIKEDGRELVSADGRIRLSLVSPLLVPVTSDIIWDSLDVNQCSPSFCRGTSRCYYTASYGSCVVKDCRPAKSCE